MQSNAMKQATRRSLARSQLRVPIFGLGCAQLGGLYCAMSDAEAARLLECAWQRGVRLFDTAPYYGFTRSERRLGSALAHWPRDEFVLSTKVGRLMRPDDSVRSGDGGFIDPLPFRPYFDYSRNGVLRSFDESLARLGVSGVDILYVHDIGTVTHGERHASYWQQLTKGGGFRALEELRRSGAVAAVGLGVNEWQVAHASMDEFDLDCTMLAGRYTLLEQTALAPFLDECQKRGNAVVAAGPFNSGVIAGGSTFNYAPIPPPVRERVHALQSACLEFDVPLPAAALQFALAHPAVVACVVGAHSDEQLRQNLAWFNTSIPPALWLALRERGLVDSRAPLPDA
jgi:D-threo-aldose 1-dehydrogenase